MPPGRCDDSNGIETLKQRERGEKRGGAKTPLCFFIFEPKKRNATKENAGWSRYGTEGHDAVCRVCGEREKNIRGEM